MHRRNGSAVNFFGSCRQEDSGAFFCGGSGGEYIIQNQNALPPDIRVMHKPVRAQHIGLSLGILKDARLRRCISNFAQQPSRTLIQFPTNLPCQKLTLVISALQPPDAADRYPSQDIKFLRAILQKLHSKKPAEFWSQMERSSELVSMDTAADIILIVPDCCKTVKEMKPVFSLGRRI